MERSTKTFIGFLGLLIVVNLIFLDIKVLIDRRQNIGQRIVQIEEKIAGGEVENVQVIDEVKKVSPKDEKPKASVIASPKPKTVYVPAPMSQLKEVYIPLGSGSTNSTEWLNTGAQAYINTDLYSNINAVYFEASLKSNSGGVRVRLLQNNEGRVVPGSEISSSVPASTFKSSGEILLSGGNKLYIVQIRSETGQEVFVENARVKLRFK